MEAMAGGVTDAGFEVRTRNTGELLDAALRLTRLGWRSNAVWLALGQVPAAAFLVILAGNGDGSDDQVAAVAGWLALGFAIFGALTLFLPVAAMNSLHGTYIASPVSGRSSAWRAIKRLPILFVFWIVASFINTIIGTGLILGFGALARGLTAAIGVFRFPLLTAVVAVVITAGGVAVYLGLWVRTQVGSVAVVVQRSGPFDGFSRGWRLTRGVWPRYGLVTLIAYLLAFVIALVATVMFQQIAGRGSGRLWFAGVASLVGIALGTVLFTFLSALSVVFYVDGQVRVDGLDIELLARRLAVVPEGSNP